MRYKKNSALIHPNYAMVHQEMQTRDMTLKLLHFEYLASMDDKLEQTISYSTFSHTYSAWIKKQRISMRQTYKVGDKMFVDFCGKTIPITNMKTGEIVKAQIFVAVLGASRYTFAYAVPSQKINDWLSCHIQAFEYFEGVPNQVVPDNLKAAVIKNKKDEIILNRSYMNLSDYYQFIISPTRTRKPKDKSLAEISVQIIQRWILAPLRHHKFFSIEELNKEISKGLDILNNKQTRSFAKSRRNLFLEIEKRALKPLPNELYLINEWKYKIKVPNDYHIEHDGHFYSVPYHHIGQNVDIRVGEQIIEIFIHNQRITSHIRKFDRGLSTHLEHGPIEHQEQAMNEPDALITWSNSLRHYTSQWVKENLQNRRDFANGLRSVKRLREWLREEQNLEEIESACEFVLKYRILGFRSLMDTIKNKHYMRNITPPNMPVLQHNNIRGANYYKDKK